jgi:hypothetical protein
MNKMKRNNWFAATLLLVAMFFAAGLGIMGCSNPAGPPASNIPSNPKGNGDPSNKSSSLAAPTGLVSVTATETSIVIAWDTVSGAESYMVYADIHEFVSSLKGTAADASYTITELEPNTDYYIKVSAVNAAREEGTKSVPLTVKTSTADIPPPAAPTGLASLTHSDTSIFIEWNSVNGATKYNVYAGVSAASLSLKGSAAAESFNITELESATAYYIAVSAENEGGEGNKSSVINVTTKTPDEPKIPPPEAPTDLKSSAYTENSISIEWDSASGAVFYNVYMGTEEESLYRLESISVTSFDLKDLGSSSTYYIAVSAENEGGEGDKSDVITVTTKPAKPTGLEYTSVKDTSIAIEWVPVNGENTYNVYAGINELALSLKGTSTTTSYTITGLAPYTAYYIAVSAKNTTHEEGEKSGVITVTTQHFATPPSGLEIGEVTDDSITVLWDAVDGVTGYKVYAGVTADTLELMGSPEENSYTIEDLVSNTEYYIAVSSWKDKDESNQSNTVYTLTKPAAPTGLAASAATSNSIAITWTSIDGVTGYSVYSGSSNIILVPKGNPTTNTFTITGLEANKQYYIAVSAKNTSGEGSKSSTITVTTKLAAPTGVSAAPLSGTNTIQVSWNTVTGATGYKVYGASSATGTYSLINTVAGNSSFNHANLETAKDYYYKVSALAGDVEGEVSDYVSGRLLVSTKNITTFGITDPFSVTGTINGTNISVTAPNIVNLTKLVPTIVHNGKSISPASGTEQNFSSPVQYTVTAEDGTTQNYTITVSVTNTGLAAAFSWLNSNYTAGREYAVVAQAGETIAATTINLGSPGTNILLSGGSAERTISVNANGSLFTVSGGTLTLDNNITLSGRGENNTSLVKVNNANGKLVMKAGSKIVNNTIKGQADSQGSGVSVTNSGTFVLEGGTISGNKFDHNSSTSSFSTTVSLLGVGVYVNGGTFTITSGTISNNTSKSDLRNHAGGGVFVNNGTFTMSGGTISGNTLESVGTTSGGQRTYGGGVAVWDKGTFTITGGTINGNKCAASRTNPLAGAADSLGGGVFRKSGGIFNNNGGTISGNTAANGADIKLE